MRTEEAILLYALLKGYKINVGKIIEKSILRYSEGNCRGMIPHPGMITRLCIQGGVDEEWGIEETYPRASPLTLTGVTKGPKNRGKGEKKETEEQKGNEGYTELEQWESPSQIQQEVQSSQSQFWSAPPELRQNQHEQAESSGQNCNHTELIELLMSMQKEMKARDDQLRTQLQLREEYFDAEIKRRDHNLEDAFRKNDEVWRVEIERRGIEWRTVLRDRDNVLKGSMDSRDNNFMNSLEHCKQSFRLLSYDVRNDRTLLESLAMRQRELIESNAKILDWAMKTVYSKKKIPLPQIRISDCRPYSIIP